MGRFAVRTVVSVSFLASGAMPAVALLLIGLCFASPLAAETFLVEDGQPRAAIVVAESPPRTVRLAAQELQNYVAEDHRRICRSSRSRAARERCRSTSDAARTRTGWGSRRTACRTARIASCRATAGWCCIGQDTEFTPIEPWARSNADIVSGKLQREWDQITGALWGVPHGHAVQEPLHAAGRHGLARRAAASRTETRAAGAVGLRRTRLVQRRVRVAA